MKKFIKSFVFIFLFLFLPNPILHANSNFISNLNRSDGFHYDYFFSVLDGSCHYKNSSFIANFTKKDLAILTSPPLVSSPIYYCQNAAAVALSAAATSGGTLNWYGTNATGGTPSGTAPIPVTTTVGTTSYYVSETVGSVQSTRAKIDVIVVANNGASILNLRCDPSQILPADRASSVLFDWSNNPLISNSYNYSYTIQGGSPITGNRGLSNLQIFSMLPGQSATLILSSATHPCVPSQSITCSVPCGTATTTPNFAAIAPICSGTLAAVLGPTSPNGIIGTWTPAIINNTVTGSYVFTPIAAQFPCATTQTLNVVVRPVVTPSFIAVPSTICQNSTAPILLINSNNIPAISGSWSPSSVNTAVTGAVTYTFTPNANQCTSSTLTRVTINILPFVTPNFASIPPICSGTTAPLLATTSPNGIAGAWAPSIISNTVSRSYVFTPNSNQCAAPQTLNVTIIPKGIPNFPAITPFCTGTTAPILATTSPNGIAGTWSPSTVSNTTAGSYIFTPNASECANSQTLPIAITPLTSPSFSDLSICTGGLPPILNTTSPNGISGTWSPATVNNMAGGAYMFSPNANQCATSQTINVTVTTSNTLLDINWTVSEAFMKNQMVTVSVIGTGSFLYQLDDGAFQESPIFENVSYGTHTITVKDKFGCSAPITRTNVLVINYPKFFTPNDDGYNDTWNISTLDYLTNSRIFIFDRYGKLLKEINAKSLGWDGMYNGNQMPSNDYWFNVEYVENDISKIFKAHFSLKR